MLAFWLIGGIILAIGAGAFTLLWWKLGDQWADDEYKKFGHGGGAPNSAGPKVIRSDDLSANAPSTEAETD